MLNSFLIKQIWYPGILDWKPPKDVIKLISLDLPHSGWECSELWVPVCGTHTHPSPFLKLSTEESFIILVGIKFLFHSVPFQWILFHYLLWSPLPAILALVLRLRWNIQKLIPTLSLAGGPHLQSLWFLLDAIGRHQKNLYL